MLPLRDEITLWLNEGLRGNENLNLRVQPYTSSGYYVKQKLSIVEKLSILQGTKLYGLLPAPK